MKLKTFMAGCALLKRKGKNKEIFMICLALWLLGIFLPGSLGIFILILWLSIYDEGSDII